MTNFKETLIQKAKTNSKFTYTSKPSGDKLIIQFPDKTHHLLFHKQVKKH